MLWPLRPSIYLGLFKHTYPHEISWALVKISDIYVKSEWYYKSYCVPKDCHKWNRFMGQEILRGNLADFGFALHRTTKISNRMEKVKMKIRLLMILFMRDIW